MIIERQPGPVEQQAVLLLERVGAVGHNGDTRIGLSRLIDLLGANSHLVVLLVFSMLNMIPGPPGYGGTIAIATFSFALAMVLDRPIRLPALVGNRRVPLAPLLKMLERLLLVSRKLNRVSQPRAEFLTGPTARRVLGGFIMVVCTVMVVPIPFINAVPNIGLSVMCFAMLNRDGVGVVLGIGIAVIGLILAALLIYGAVLLGIAASGAIAA